MYELILNESKLINFIEFLPELKENEVYFVALFARSKYTDVAIRNKVVKSFYCKKESLLNKIKELEIKEGLYMSKGNSIPNEALVLYISPNPRNTKKANINTLKECLDKTLNNIEFDLISTHLTEIQKSKGTTHFVDFDFDGIEFENVKETILNYVNKEAVNILHTRGGFHLLLKLDLLEDKFRKSFYENIKKIKGVDVSGDNLVPIAGCSQGLFEPYLEVLI